jgi:dTDP-4-dehydrorhamnose reductase
MRVLVTGVGGLIGSNLAAAAAQQSWEAIGCYREQPLKVDGVQSIAVDVAAREQCVAAAMEFDPDVIVHAAAGGAPSRFEREPRLAELDYLGTEHTIAAARAVRARYVLLSCDWVYSGYRPAGSRFAESDPPAPVNAYGRSKLACEQAAMRANLPWLIVRPADVYGVNMARPPHRAAQARYVWERSGLALRLVKRLREHAALPAPRGVWRSSTYAWDFAQRMCELVAQGCEGVYNMGGDVSLGRYEWAKLLAAAFDCEAGLVQEGTVEAYLAACGEDPRLELPSNTALSEEKANAAIGSLAVAPERGLRLMREQLRRMLKPVGEQAR